MKTERTKVYTYTRVSTAIQVDEYSLDAQKNKMKAFAEFNDYEIVGEYEDAGKSDKSIEGRIQKTREGRWNGGFAPYGYQMVSWKSTRKRRR